MKKRIYIGLNLGVICVALVALAMFEDNRVDMFKSIPYALIATFGFLINAFLYLKSHNKKSAPVILISLVTITIVSYMLCITIVTILTVNYPQIQYDSVESTTKMNLDGTPIFEQVTPRYFFNSFTRGLLIFYVAYCVLFTLLVALTNFLLTSSERKRNGN